MFHNAFRSVLFLFLLTWAPYIYSDNCPQSCEANNNPINDNEYGCKGCPKVGLTLTYYLFIDDFISSFIQIPTSNVLVDSSTIASSYLAGRAPVYDRHNIRVGTCSATFLNMQNAESIFTDISNYLSIDNGPIVSWFTPTTLLNLELDSIVNGMVTECIVVASTKIGVNPFYGKTFNMIVSSDGEKIYFKLTKI